MQLHPTFRFTPRWNNGSVSAASYDTVRYAEGQMDPNLSLLYDYRGRGIEPLSKGESKQGKGASTAQQSQYQTRVAVDGIWN